MDPSHPPSFAFAALLDLSVIDVFAGGGLTVQGVIIVLLGALGWTIVIAVGKYADLARMGREADAFERLFWSGPSLDELYTSMNAKQTGSLPAIFMAAMYEWRRTMETSARALPGVLERMERLMAVSVARERHRMEKGLVSLSIIARVAPLVGLAGALWGAMRGVLVAEGGSEAMAPAMAQGLLAGAVGLFAGAAALAAHRALMRTAQCHERRMKDFAQEFSAIVSRQIEPHT